jgi:hypothetical protein
MFRDEFYVAFVDSISELLLRGRRAQVRSSSLCPHAVEHMTANQLSQHSIQSLSLTVSLFVNNFTARTAKINILSMCFNKLGKTPKVR